MSKDDCISRRDAIDAMKDMYRAAEKWLRDATDDVTKARAESCMAILVEIKLRIEKIPVVQPDHVADISKKVKVEDCIGRQMVIDALDMAIERYDEMAEEYRKKADIERNDYMDMRDDAYEAQQLAQWLNELKYLREKIEQITIMPEPRWIPCSERLPSETVIATVETKPFKHRYVCEAVWIPRWTRKVLFDEWEDCSEYKEDDDEYYALEGWYERVYNWDEYAYVAIDDNVIAWLPLTKPYGGGDAK